MTPESVRRQRLAHGLTVRALGDLLGVHEGTVYKIETGRIPIDTRWRSHLELVFAGMRAAHELTDEAEQ